MSQPRPTRGVGPKGVAGLKMPANLVTAGPDREPLVPRLTADELAERLRPAVPPPGVLPKGKRLAMDSLGGMATWIAGAQYNVAFMEGWTFMGYPYLSQLSVIPEYRLLGATIAEEATRKWGEVRSRSGSKSQAKRIEELTDELKRLGAKKAFETLSQQDSWFGRSHLYMDTGDTDEPKELRKPLGDGGKLSATKLWPAGQRKGRRGRLRALKTVEPVWTYPSRYDAQDPLKDNWYRPDTWYVNGKEVHASRMLPFISREVPDILKPAFSFGGLSLSQMAKPYVDNWLQTRQSVNDLIQAFSTMVLKTDLQSMLQTGGDQLAERVRLFASYRTNKSVFAIDKNSEDFANVSAPLSGLDKLQAQAQEHICCPAQIPLVKYTGITPSGLNASSDAEIRVFYDREHAYQESFFGQGFEVVFKMAQINIWGEVDDDLFWEFLPLYELTELQLAELSERKANADKTLIDAGALAPEESRMRLAEDPDQTYGDIDPNEVPEIEIEPGNVRERVEDDEGEETTTPGGKKPDTQKPAKKGAAPGVTKEKD